MPTKLPRMPFSVTLSVNESEQLEACVVDAWTLGTHQRTWHRARGTEVMESNIC